MKPRNRRQPGRPRLPWTAVDRTSVEQSDGNVVGKSGLGLQRDRDQVVQVYGRRHSEISLGSDWENTGGNEINRSPFLQILATTARAFTWSTKTDVKFPKTRGQVRGQACR